MLFMVIETFRNQDAKAVYTRLKEKGIRSPAVRERSSQMAVRLEPVTVVINSSARVC